MAQGMVEHVFLDGTLHALLVGGHSHQHWHATIAGGRDPLGASDAVVEIEGHADLHQPHVQLRRGHWDPRPRVAASRRWRTKNGHLRCIPRSTMPVMLIAMNMRVLIVEDDRYLVEELKRLLSMIDGCQIVYVSDVGDDALAWVAAHPKRWDLALIDIFLRQGHGFSVAKMCKRVGSGKVAMMSNYARDEVKEQMAKQGIDAFFDKSADLNQLALYCRHLAQALCAQEHTRRDSLPLLTRRQHAEGASQPNRIAPRSACPE